MTKQRAIEVWNTARWWVLVTISVIGLLGGLYGGVLRHGQLYQRVSDLGERQKKIEDCLDKKVEKLTEKIEGVGKEVSEINGYLKAMDK